MRKKSADQRIIDIDRDKGRATQRVSGFDAGQEGDVLRLSGFSLKNFEALYSSARQVGDNTVLQLKGKTIVLKDVSVSELTRENFTFDLDLSSSGHGKRVVHRAVSGVVEGTSKNDSFGAGADMTFIGGLGDDTYGVSSISKNVTFVEKAGQGIDTVNSWVSFMLPKNQSIENITLFGTGAINATGNALDNRITGNSGNNVLTGGAGDDLLIGNGGNDTFVVKAGDGLDVVSDFKATGKDADIVRLERFSFENFDDLRAVMTQSGNDTMIWLGANNTLVLKNTRLSDLTEANFRFVDVIAADPSKQTSLTVLGTAEDDVLEGASANDIITGGRGDDIMTGGAARDTFIIAKGDGNDVISDFTAGASGDLLQLRGFDFVSFEAFQAALTQVGADTVVNLGDGQKLVLQGTLASALTIANLGLDLDLPQAAAINNWLSTAQIVGGQLIGTAKNDSFAAAADVTYAGGLGDDVYGISSITKNLTIVEKLGEGIDTVNSWVSFALPTDQYIENITLFGNGAINATGNALDNRLTGNSSNNILTGGAGNDVLTGAGGNDTFVIRPGEGLDVVADFTASGSGADIIRIERFRYADFAALKAVMTQVGNDTMIWLAAGNTLVLKNTLMGDLTAANFQFADVIPSIPSIPAIGVDIVGGADAETLTGTASAELIDGRAGNDTLTGGNGRDTFVITKGNGTDTITDFDAGNGGDVIRLQGYGFTDFAAVMASATQSGNNTLIKSGTETLTLIGVQKSDLNAGNFTLDYILSSGGATSTTLTALNAGETLNGTSGNDNIATNNDNVTLVGGMGDDVYTVLNDTTKIIEKNGEGVDTVKVWTGEGYVLSSNQSIENLTLMGTSNSWGMGNGLANIITGTSGDNVLVGRGGDDILTGGAGKDIFLLEKGDGSDVITDFSAADKVSLSGYGFTSFADIQSHLRQIGRDAVLDLGGGESLTLRGVSISSLTASNFALPIDTSDMVSTFADEFNTSFSWFHDGAGTWQTSFVFGGDHAYFNNGEQQVAVDQYFKGLTDSQCNTALGINPYAIDNGELVITAAPIAAGVKQYMGKQDFTSGIMTSESSFWQTYGYFEISTTLPKDKGSWPAFWMLPVDKVSPVELDIFEGLGSRGDAIHVQTHGSNSSEMGGTWVPVDDISGNHTYGALWTPYAVTFYVDGLEVASYATPQDMNRPMYLIAGLAMGGSWGGAADPTKSSSTTIDYIRTYQLQEYTLAGYTLKTSGASTNTLNGTSGVESLIGTTANDLLDSRGGADTLTGKLGDDTYIVSDSGAKIVEGFGEGIDTVQSSASFTLGSNVENLTLTGTAAIGANGNSMANTIIGNSGDNTITGGQGGDILTGRGGRDTFVISKGDGSDIITDFSEAEGDKVQLLKYAFTSFEEIKSAMTQVGNDTYLKLSPYDTLVFRNEKISDFTSNAFVLPEKPAVSEASIRWEMGTAGADHLYGTGANQTYQGRGGADIFEGGLGDDIYYVDSKITVVEKAGEGVDTAIFSTYGTYTLTENVENLTLSNSATGIGNKLGNLITGSSGADTINGKGGYDWLIGGAGNDTFVIEKNMGRDTIADFHSSLGSGTERDHINFTGYNNDATLTHDGDVWTIHHSGGDDTFRLVGVTSLSASDYSFL